MEIFAGFIPLTKTEMVCLQRCAEGEDDAGIGRELELTSVEVGALMSIAVMKMSFPNRFSAIAKATSLGLVKT